MLNWRRFILVLVIAVAAACASPTSDSRSDDNGENDIGALGGMCGGIAGFQCDGANTYCKSEPGICVDQADYSGICTTKPEVCTMQYDPVCGCDGKTYGNACSAAGSGVSVAYAGPCEGDS